MKIAFWKKHHLSKKNYKRLMIINGIIDDYYAQGYRLTLRQLYYQLVTKDVIPNHLREYAKLSDLLKKGRMAGIVDWDAIVDRNRIPRIPFWSDDPEDAVKEMVDQYRIDRQRDQDVYVEIWVEKDALSEIMYRKSAHYHMNLCVNRGYSSCTAVYRSYERFKYQAVNLKKPCTILYFGDHDPSGLDMALRDINERLEEFGTSVDVKHVGITMEQIHELNPPPNPAKMSDPRAGWYVNEFGDKSWEVDALPPDYIENVIDEQIQGLIDMDKFDAIVAEEKVEQKQLAEMPKRIDGLDEFKGMINSYQEQDRDIDVEEVQKLIKELNL